MVSFAGLDDLKCTTIEDSSGKTREFVDIVVKNRQKLEKGMTNMGELAAFICYAQVFSSFINAEASDFSHIGCMIAVLSP